MILLSSAVEKIVLVSNSDTLQYCISKVCYVNDFRINQASVFRIIKKNEQICPTLIHFFPILRICNTSQNAVKWTYYAKPGMHVLKCIHKLSAYVFIFYN